MIRRDVQTKSVKKLSQTKISSYFTGCIKSVPVSKKSPSKRKSSSGVRRRLFSSNMKTEAMELTEKIRSTNVSPENLSLIANIPKRKLPAPIFSDDEDSDFEDKSKESSTVKESPKKPKLIISVNKQMGVTSSHRTLVKWKSLLTPPKNNLDKEIPSCSTTNSDNVSGSTKGSPSNKNSEKETGSKNNLDKENPSCLTTISDNCSSSAKSLPSSVSLQKELPPKNNSNNETPSRSTTNSDNSNSSAKSSAPNVSLQKETPSCSNTKSNILNNKESSKPIRVLQNIILQSPEKKGVKDETKKVNYEQLRVMREFFVNVLKNNYLRNLLSESDRQFVYSFYDSEKNYQYVCVKLFLWKPTWYNIFKFVEKIGLSMSDSEVTVMYRYLSENGFVDVDYKDEDLFTLLDLLSLKEVRDIARSFKLPNVAGPKDHVISKLIKTCKTQTTLTTMFNTEGILKKRIKEAMGFCVKLSTRFYKCLYSIFLLNTFTNSSLINPQDYFTNVTYFNVVFPPFLIENFHIFYTPQEFLRYADSVKLRCELDKALERRNLINIFEICACAYKMLKQLNDEYGNSFDTSKEPHLERFTPNATYISILSSGAKHLTFHYYNDIMIWYDYLISQGYCNYKRGEWYCQLALIYTQYIRNYEKAAKLLIKALEEEKRFFSDIQLQELAHRGRLLNKKTYNLPPLFHDKIAALSPPSCDRAWPQDILDCKSMQSEESGRRRVYVHRAENGDVNYLTVEQTALEYYRKMGFPSGEHCEGRLIIAAFCLLFWDIMYETYVKGTFVSKVQHAPLDMYTEHFYTNREKLIKKQLNCISSKWTDQDLKKRISTNWDRHSHESSLCQIDSCVEGPRYLYDIITCIGRPILAKIFERLVKNFRIYQSGFPDLIVWNIQQKKAKFVEVKSQNDKLSIKQKLWLNYLIDIGASVAVCHVEPKSSKKKLNVTKK